MAVQAMTDAMPVAAPPSAINFALNTSSGGGGRPMIRGSSRGVLVSLIDDRSNGHYSRK